MTPTPRRRRTLALTGLALLSATAIGFAAELPRRGSGAAPRPAATTTPATTRPVNYRERYATVVEHNIFVKDRRRLAESVRNAGRPPTTVTTNSNAPRESYRPPPEASFVLRGIVLEDGDFRAYVEDVAAGKELRLSPGDPVARGRVADIGLDAMVYEAGGQATIVDTGRTLTGMPFVGTARPGVATAGGTPTTGAATTGPAGTATAGGAPAVAPLPIDPNNPNLTMEERLRLRRQQETKR